ncbi:caspase recruitment domain-containing protein 6 isoform X3 [Triplophysa dalaica]|uniref:caspase recruitment domain-containing protein 6 isoform X3 n=1 Tax=Triplophysa dalaica TaxID=1582913 RepID=UPI0024DFD40E|nr:caspase recruitment domain-containing protein 6 isoform X3 [Triplophysa dalaica]
MDKTVLRNKPKLVNWLSGDHYGILQHVQSREFITDTEYETLKSISVPQKQVIDLLDIILKKGERVCGDFLKMLLEDEVNEFSPELRKWIKTVKISDTTDNVLAQTTSRHQAREMKKEHLLTCQEIVRSF